MQTKKAVIGAAAANSHFVRKVDLGGLRSESPLPADSVEKHVLLTQKVRR